MNVEVLEGSLGFVSGEMEFVEVVQPSQSSVVDITTVLTDASKKSFSRGTEGPALPAGALLARIALPALKDPLQRIIHDPPVLVELRYQAI